MLPYITNHLDGIGGEIKLKPEDFAVEEIPLYSPCGDGEHVYVCLERIGIETRVVQKRLAEIFGLGEDEIGCAGLKDKHARVTQTFSIHSKLDEELISQKIAENLPVRVLWARRHKNKLKVGHLLGNQFQIVVSSMSENALSKSKNICEELNRHGVPNYYGYQRFGTEKNNAKLGKEILLGLKKAFGWEKKFLLSAYQSELFNLWLEDRIKRGLFEKIIKGDIAKKSDTGGIFEVEDEQVDNDRLKNREITYTGPIYGSKMRWANGEPGKLEGEILEKEGISAEVLKKSKLTGSRRSARIFLKDFSLESCSESITFGFFLPKGSYATTVLREFMKND